MNVKERYSVLSSQTISYTQVLAHTLGTPSSADSLGMFEGENRCQCQALLLGGGHDCARSGSRICLKRLHVAALRGRNENSNLCDVTETGRREEMGRMLHIMSPVSQTK